MSKAFEIIAKEEQRQQENIELIASENFCSGNVMKAVGSCLTNKYAEGYPYERTSGSVGRYYGGTRYVDELEEYCCDMWRKVFDTDYHVNVQPHSGSSANLAAYMAVLKPGDTILGMDLNEGGHLTHGSPVNFSGRIFNAQSYRVDEQGFIDYDEVRRRALELKPQMIVAGASAYPRFIDFEKFHEIAEEAGAYFMVDMAHIAGLIAGGVHPSPFGYADIITSTTHKTLRGPRGGMIFARPDLAKKIDSGIFPCCQGGPLVHVIAGKAVAAEEALEPEYKEYTRRVVDNCWAMADEFMDMGYDLVTGGTDNHLLLIDLTKEGVTGLAVQEELDKYRITLNKNCVPGEKRSPKLTSGVRIGTPAMTTRGYDQDDFRRVARKIDKIIKGMDKEQA